MQQFNIKPNAFQEIRKTVLIKSFFLTVLVIGTVFCIYFFISKDNNTNTFVFTIPLLLISVFIGLYRGINRQKKIIESYTLIFDKETIIRKQYNTPEISLPYSQVSAILKTNKGAFAIRGNSSIEVISIPYQIENSEEIENILNEIKPIQEQNNSFLQKIISFFPILVLALMATVFISMNKIIVAVSGLIAVSSFGYSVYISQKSKNVDKSTKKLIWVSSFVVFSILLTMYYKLFVL